MNKHTLSTAKNGPREIGKTITKALQGMILMLLAGLATNNEAWASQVVIPGSTYVYAVYGISSSLSLFTNTFDGVAETFTRGAAQITINEQMLPSNHGYKLLIHLRSTSDIFPVAGEDGYVNIGGFSDPLDLADNLMLTSAEMTYLSGPSLSVAASATGSVSQPNPWNGYYTAAGIANGFTGIGGSDVRGVDLVFNLIPEPTSLALLGLGLFVMAGRREKGGS
jgi:hypothetical protein